MPSIIEEIVMGNFSCIIGQLHNNFPSTVGKHAQGTDNARGDLAKFCTRNYLLITALCLRRKSSFLGPRLTVLLEITLFSISLINYPYKQVDDSSAKVHASGILDQCMASTKIKTNFS